MCAAGGRGSSYTPLVSTDATTWFVATSREKKRRVTIVDVARKAGVNKGTVSRALRGMDGVGDETRRRILAAADELEYSASELGTALATGSTRTVAIVLPTYGPGTSARSPPGPVRCSARPASGSS